MFFKMIFDNPQLPGLKTAWRQQDRLAAGSAMQGNEQRSREALGVDVIVLKAACEDIGKSVRAARDPHVVNHEQRLAKIKPREGVAEDGRDIGAFKAKLQIPHAINTVRVKPDCPVLGYPVKETGFAAATRDGWNRFQPRLGDPAALIKPDDDCCAIRKDRGPGLAWSGVPFGQAHFATNPSPCVCTPDILCRSRTVHARILAVERKTHLV
jgi:hypothetical protein